MIIHCDYQLVQDDCAILLSGGMAFEPESPDDEVFPIGTPKCWDETFLQRVDIESYSILHICMKCIEHGWYNTVTDYGKVWKLFKVPKGDFDGSYFTDSGKVYFGIKRGFGEKSFLSDTSPILLMLPKGLDVDYNRIYSSFRDNKVDFSDSEQSKHSMHVLAESISGAIALIYGWGSGGWLTIYGKNIGSIFVQEDLRKWPVVNPELVFRRNLWG